MTDWIFDRPVVFVGLLFLTLMTVLFGGLYFVGSERDGAVIVRICNDGSYIYRLRDGRTVTGTREVENIETVCGAVK